MVAVIGLGRASDGSLLSSEDLEILKTMSGYIAVAIENSRLYQEQQQQTEELALLKEFNESIVESVNVGLLAVDEDGRITRCNSTFEDLMGAQPQQVVGKLVEEVFDESFAFNLEQYPRQIPLAPDRDPERIQASRLRFRREIADPERRGRTAPFGLELANRCDHRARKCYARGSSLKKHFSRAKSFPASACSRPASPTR